jgi:hypothetical protein
MLEELELIQGEFGPSKAVLYARLPTPPTAGDWQLSGKVRGPLNDFSETLPTQFGFRDLGAQPTLLAAATIVDPCAWLPGSPMRYEIEVSLERNGKVVETAKRGAVLKDFAIRGKSLYLGGKRWVARGCVRRSIHGSLHLWREAECIRVIRRIDYGLLMESNRIGLPTIVVPRDSETLSILELRRLSRYGTVMMVVYPTEKVPDEAIASSAPNLVLAQMLKPDEPLLPWVHCAWVNAASTESFAKIVGNMNVPVVAFRRSFATSLPEARAAIDTLQADLAPIGQFAGYVV